MFPFQAGLLNVTERVMGLGGEIGEGTSGGNLRENAQEGGGRERGTPARKGAGMVVDGEKEGKN